MLAAAAKTLQARADAGEEDARISAGAPPTEGNDATPSALVDAVAKHEARVSALRARLKQLDEEEDMTRMRLQKVTAVTAVTEVCSGCLRARYRPYREGGHASVPGR